MDDLRGFFVGATQPYPSRLSLVHALRPNLGAWLECVYVTGQRERRSKACLILDFEHVSLLYTKHLRKLNITQNVNMSGPASYGPNAGYHAPPGQGYDPSYPPPPEHGGYTDEQYQGYNPPPAQHAAYDPHSGHPIPPGYVPPSRPPPSSYDPNNFPPPPREDYKDDGYSQAPPRSEYDRGYERGPHDEYGYNDRPYAPSEPYGHEGNQLAPFDEEKADAEYRRGYEEEQRRNYAVPPPPSDAELRNRHRQHDDRDRRYDDRYDDRYRDDRDRRSYSDDRSSYDDRDRRHEGRRRDSRQSPTSPTKSNAAKDIFGGREGERGLGAQVLGGAMGGLAGHEFGKGGMLQTLGGIVVGAMGAKALENEHEKRKSKKGEAMRSAAPYKNEAVTGERYGSSHAERRREFQRDRRAQRRPSERSRSRSRRSRSRSRRRSGSESDSYSSDGSPPPPRR